MVPTTQPVFDFTQPPEAWAREHSLGDDGLTSRISRFVCCSFSVHYQGCFCRWDILESAKRLSEYLHAVALG